MRRAVKSFVLALLVAVALYVIASRHGLVNESVWKRGLSVPFETVFSGSLYSIRRMTKNATYQDLLLRMKNGERFLTTGRKASERFGNTIFQYAALYGISKQYNLTPILKHDEWFFYIIERSPMQAVLMDNSEWDKVPWVVVGEKWPCADSRAEMQTQLNDQNLPFLHMRGYFQSYKYFRNVELDLLSQIAIHENISQAALQYVNLNVKQNTTSSAVWVSVHIRRADLQWDRNLISKGYKMATQKYLENAVQFFLSRFPREQLIFIVSSDDLQWSRSNFPQTAGQTIFVESAAGSQGYENTGRDFAIQLLCNHSIMTVGSFGYWAAYLKKAKTPRTLTVYYDSPFQPGTQLAAEWNNILTDYYPPEWVALSG